MSTWYSSLASRVKDAVFASEADGDTEDDTHVCRVLRNYYTEKGQAFPAWLPPDPKAPAPAPVAQQPPPSRYGAGLQGSQSAGGGLSSLWDKRRAEGGGASAPPAGVNARNPFARNNAPAAAPEQAVQARPLPSQRTGSYQTTGSVDSVGSNRVQDRLKSRLGGGARTTSPSSSSGPFAPPPQQGGGSGGSYERSSGGGGGSGDYDPYRAGSYDGGSSGGDAQPPSGGGRFGGGLPSGPRRMGGLPSGPRMR